VIRDLSAILEPLDLAIQEGTPEELARLLGDLVQLEELVRLRLRTAAVNADNGGRIAEQDHDENLNAAEAARRLGISRDWLYKNRGRLPFAVRLGRRVVFSARGLERWNRQQMNR
jgi:predicted DNA-binding transcriptional regulator AlpA